MKWMVLCGMPAIVGGGLYFHGPLRSGEVYARPAGEVAYTLETMSLPEAIAETLNSIPSGNSTRVAVPGKSVTYYFQARGAQAAKFVAEIEPVDETHTRVTTHMEMADDAEKLLKTRFMPVAKMFDQVGTAAMREQIDARLENRLFDKKVVERAAAGFAIANIGAIQQSASEAMSEAARLHDEPSDRMRQDDVRFVPGRPMVDTDPTLR